jgi:lipoprotein
MKKFFAFAFVAVAAAFASCAGNNEQNATDSVAAVDSAVVEAAAAVDSAAMMVDSAATAVVDSLKK